MKENKSHNYGIYRLGELPVSVITYAEGAGGYIDTEHGRYHLCPGDRVIYDDDWNPIRVIQRNKSPKYARTCTDNN